MGTHIDTDTLGSSFAFGMNPTVRMHPAGLDLPSLSRSVVAVQDQCFYYYGCLRSNNCNYHVISFTAGQFKIYSLYQLNIICKATM